jgi:uncharacterized protein
MPRISGRDEVSFTDDVNRRILWRRLDREGHEAARLELRGAGWQLSGAAVFAHEGQACALRYVILCDASWKTVSANVAGWVGEEPLEIEILRAGAGDGRWRSDGVEQPQLAGCVDIDLNFSPSTNLLPIRRLSLPVGGQAPVMAAWLRFPSFRLEVLEQTYRRLADRRYRYESAGGSFTAELEVDDAGFPTLYPGLAERVV